MEGTSVIAYGGSIVIPGEHYDEKAIERLAGLVEQNPQRRFIVIIGGGKLCRNIQQASQEYLRTALSGINGENIALDEIGIAVTKINARTVIRKLMTRLGEGIVHPDYVDNPEILPETDAKVIIASGFRPRVTTDYCMMRLAELSTADSAIKISNFPIVLDVEPTAFDKERIDTYEKLESLSWSEITSLVGDTAIAGGNYPLDPPAAQLGKRLAQERQFVLHIGMSTEIENMIEGRAFYGTTVKGE
ncbi:MAG: hypothetical protein ACQESE_04060 [Nanobdellota archaeon]